MLFPLSPALITRRGLVSLSSFIFSFFPPRRVMHNRDAQYNNRASLARIEKPLRDLRTLIVGRAPSLSSFYPTLRENVRVPNQRIYTGMHKCVTVRFVTVTRVCERCTATLVHRDTMARYTQAQDVRRREEYSVKYTFTFTANVCRGAKLLLQQRYVGRRSRRVLEPTTIVAIKELIRRAKLRRSNGISEFVSRATGRMNKTEQMLLLFIEARETWSVYLHFR